MSRRQIEVVIGFEVDDPVSLDEVLCELECTIMDFYQDAHSVFSDVIRDEEVGE